MEYLKHDQRNQEVGDRNQSMGSSIKEFYQEYTNKGYKAVEKIYREVEEWKWKKD